MSKNSRRRKRKRNELPKDGWEFFTRFERCEDCDLRDAIGIDGKPRRDFDPHHRKLRRKGLSWMINRPRTIDDCEACHGRGFVRRKRK